MSGHGNIDWDNWTGWRWTALSINTVGDLHGSLLPVALVGGLVFATLGIFWKFGLPLILVYTGYLLYCRRQRRGPYEQLQALYVRHVAGCQWRTR